MSSEGSCTPQLVALAGPNPLLVISPHYLAPQSPAQPDSFSDYLLKPGEVIDVIYPEDPRSFSKKLVEYAVEVQFLDPQTRTGRARPYRATFANHLAGVAEREVLVLRSDTPDRKTGIGRGSKVLVACLNGEQNAAIIVGGLRDASADDDLGLKDLKEIYRRDINGVSEVVRTDGSMSVVVTGPKDLKDETTKDPDRLGGLQIAANGSSSIGTASSAGDAHDDYVRVNASNRRVEIRADGGLYVGEATDAMPLFSTYRQAQSNLHSQLQAQMTACQVALTAASTALSAAATTMLLPIVGPIIASPGVALVATQLSLVAQSFLQMQLAVQQFEARSETYVSNKNKND